jgi:hypothetical protein
MALSNIINPPKRVQFILSDSAGIVEEEATLGGVLPLPDVLGLSASVILSIDATPRQTHRLSQQIPQHPVEEGFDISDDKQTKPKRLTIDGVISDTPSDLVAAIAEPIASLIRGESLSSSAWQVLKGLMGEQVDGVVLQPDLDGVPFDVQTGLDLYRNMLIEDVVVNRTSETGEAIWFTANLKEIRTVSSETIATGRGTGVPIGAGADADRGRVGAATPSDESTAQATATQGAIAP